MPFGPWPGVQSGAKFLVDIYNNGLVSPTTDNLFQMLHGTTMRFQAGTDLPANELPYFATYDAVAGGAAYAATGIPASGWSLATANGTEGRVFAAYQQFNPAWDGTFNHLGAAGGIFVVETGNFLQAAQTAWNRGGKLFERHFTPGGPPESFPFPVSGAGTMVHETWLYNDFQTGLLVAATQDGAGQARYGMWPENRGITWQWATHAKWDDAGGTQVNDGVGWGIFEHDINHPTNNPRGGLTCRAQDLLGNWYWSFLVSDGAGGFTDIADFAKNQIEAHVPAQFDQVVTLNGGVAPTNVVGLAYASGVVDFQTIGFYAFTLPSVPGKTFQIIGQRVRVSTRDAALTTVPMCAFAQNSADISLAVAVANTTSWNSFAAPADISFAPSAIKPVDTTTFNLQVHVTVPAAGSGLTTCTGYVEVIGVWS